MKSVTWEGEIREKDQTKLGERGGEENWIKKDERELKNETGGGKEIREIG